MTVVNPTSTGTLGIFVSDALTGDGSEETIPHSLGRVPAIVLPVVIDNQAEGDEVLSISSSADATNVYITATTNVIYKVLAM